MTIWKKAISVGTSAALLASLLITAAAPSAFAQISATSAGTVALGSTSSGSVTLVFTENAKGALTNAAVGTMTAKLPSPELTWVGTPVLSAPDSLGASVTVAGDELRIRITAHNPNDVEPITISGLKIKASSAAPVGDVIPAFTDNVGNLMVLAFTGTTSITGTLLLPVGIGATPGVQVKDVTGCGFSIAAPVEFNTNGPDLRTPTAVGALSGGNQVIDFPAGANQHLIGETIKSTVPQCPVVVATVKNAGKVSVSGTPTVFPGESNNDAGNIIVSEPVAPRPPAPGFLAKDTVITYTIATDGVVFSSVPSVTTGDNGLTVGTPVLSADRKVVTVKVTAPSVETPSSVTLNSIFYDVAASVAGGTYVDVNVTLSSGLLTGNPAENAIVFRGIDASATTPTVYIGENSQGTGLVSLVEKAAGFFQSGTGTNNVLEVCPTGVDYVFTAAPWAKVTAGDLKLREGDVVSPDNIVQGTKDASCYYWTVWTASATASTIQIGNAGFTSGPLINVSPNQNPGLVTLEVYSGDSGNFDENLIAKVGFAVAVFRNQVAVTALAQPIIPAGAMSKGGAIQIAETANGQLKLHQIFCFDLLPRASNNMIQDTWLPGGWGLNTALVPVATASGGLLLSPVSMSSDHCTFNNRGESGTLPLAQSGGKAVAFWFEVLQQSTAGSGKLVVDNINLVTTADAPNGPVLFNVFSWGRSNTHVDFQTIVSNAKIGAKSSIKITALSALGVPPNQGPASTSTKVAQPNTFITWRFSGGAALAGKTVRILVSTKNAAGGYGPYVNLTGRVADAAGMAFFSWRATNKWVSVRAYFAGDATYLASWSPPTQGRWL